MRDDKGRFIHGHAPINPQDKDTGRFVSCKQQHTIEGTIEDQVDNILNQRLYKL